jgi:hypothetical protein
MPTQQQFSAVQKQALKQTLFIASGDLNHALQEMVNQLICFDAPKEKILSSVTVAAQRLLYLSATDAAAGFDIDLTEYNDAAGTMPRKLVDREAVRCAERLYKYTLIS